MPWRVRKSDVDIFRAQLWKDLRPFPVAADPDCFAKDCFSRELALTEASVLLILSERLGADCVPTPTAIDGTVLVMRRLRGGRLFDVIRHLRSSASEDANSAAHEALSVLMSRARERLRLVQLTLADLAPMFSHESYPLEEKLTSLLELFIRVLDLRRAPTQWRSDLEELVSYWESECVLVPFRDATTKNMFVCDERFELQQVDDADSAQRKAVEVVLASEPLSFWSSVPLVDVDFSSVVHLTSPEDDPISLHCHEWTMGSVEVLPQNFILDPHLGTPDAFRTAATLLVRYLRFGGRKLAYRLINSQGFKVRFAYDDPQFYFERLDTLCSELSPTFAEQHAGLLGLTRQIAEANQRASRADKELLAVDHLRRWYPVAHYWQQNPSESQGSA